jgi:hypothetical protein
VATIDRAAEADVNQYAGRGSATAAPLIASKRGNTGGKRVIAKKSVNRWFG